MDVITGLCLALLYRCPEILDILAAVAGGTVDNRCVVLLASVFGELIFHRNNKLSAIQRQNTAIAVRGHATSDVRFLIISILLLICHPISFAMSCRWGILDYPVCQIPSFTHMQLFCVCWCVYTWKEILFLTVDYINIPCKYSSLGFVNEKYLNVKYYKKIDNDSLPSYR